MRYALNLMLAASLCGVPFVAGCGDKTVSDDKTVKETTGGGTKVEDQKVVQHDDGTMSKTTETKTVNP